MNITKIKHSFSLLASAALCLFSTPSSAALLGVQPGFPQSSFDNQGTTVFTSPDLAVNASLIGFQFSVSGMPFFIDGSFVINAKVSAACSLLSNDPNPELIMVGDVYDPDTFDLVLSGTLLTGEIVAIGVAQAGTNTTAIDYRFNSAGGQLVTGGYWPAGKDIGATMIVENSSFLDCVQSFSGGAKGNVGPIDPIVQPPNNVGTGTQGYWKNHLSAWPLSSITIGGMTYSAAAANNLMSRPPKGDKTWSMYVQLVAAILNKANGTDTSCIQSTIDAAYAWFNTYPLGSGVKANSAGWAIGEDIHEMLDAYNNGQLCAPHRQ